MMKSKILVVGFACLSLTAVAQSNGSQNQASSPSQVKAPRDAASGQSSGKRMHKPLVFKQDATAPEAATGKATGKTMAHDDWQARTAKSSDTKGQNVSAGDVNRDATADRSKTPPSSTGQTRVATGDVNGDGRADVAATKSSGHATEQNAVINNSHSNIKNARDVSTGQASGKRQHSNLTVVKDSDKAPKK
jgi:FG-GAP repeat protein